MGRGVFRTIFLYLARQAIPKPSQKPMSSECVGAMGGHNCSARMFVEQDLHQSQNQGFPNRTLHSSMIQLSMVLMLPLVYVESHTVHTDVFAT